MHAPWERCSSETAEPAQTGPIPFLTTHQVLFSETMEQGCLSAAEVDSRGEDFDLKQRWEPKGTGRTASCPRSFSEAKGPVQEDDDEARTTAHPKWPLVTPASASHSPSSPTQEGSGGTPDGGRPDLVPWSLLGLVEPQMGQAWPHPQLPAGCPHHQVFTSQSGCPGVSSLLEARHPCSVTQVFTSWGPSISLRDLIKGCSWDLPCSNTYIVFSCLRNQVVHFM